MADHFWWRPGWRPERAYLTWHVLPTPDAAAQLRAVQARLADVDHLAVVPPHRLHITGPGVGFLDTVPAEQVHRIVDEVAQRLATVAPFTAELGAPRVGAGGVALRVVAPDLVHLRRLLREAMRAAGLEPPGSDDEPYRPHVTVAYATGPASRRTTAERLDAAEWPSPVTPVDAAHLLALRMVPPGYDWDVVARVPLGPRPPGARSA